MKSLECFFFDKILENRTDLLFFGKMEPSNAGG